jgi:type VI secretion system protein ImpK
MRQEMVNLVYPILDTAVRLKERLDRRETPDLDEEQTGLKRLLLTDAEAKQWAEYGGDDSGAGAGAGGADEAGRHDQVFLGVRYALVCWLDELFILESPWRAAWNERKLEVDLYGTNDRAWRFWEQAKVAEARHAADALEVFFLCVMLGFRGERRDQRDQLRAWVTAAKARAAQIRAQEWAYALEATPPTHVPALRAQDGFQRMVLTAGALLLGLIPVVAFVLVYRFGS